MQKYREIAWEAYLACYVEFHNTTIQKLGLSFMGDKLKESFHKWYDTTYPEPAKEPELESKQVVSAIEAITLVKWLAARTHYCPAAKQGLKPCRFGSPNDSSWCCVNCKAFLIVYGTDPSKWPPGYWNGPSHQEH